MIDIDICICVIRYVLFMQSDKDKQFTSQPDQDQNDNVSDVSKRLPAFLKRMLNFTVKLKETKVCYIA